MCCNIINDNYDNNNDSDDDDDDHDDDDDDDDDGNNKDNDNYRDRNSNDNNVMKVDGFFTRFIRSYFNIFDFFANGQVYAFLLLPHCWFTP